MQDKIQRLPAPRAILPDFAPVPRKCPRHDGWTPERQRAFVGALADTGCVQVAARMVNMTADSAYMLRRAPGAEGFRKAWEAAQGLGLQVVKDEAFHRAMHGQLVPVFVAGKLIGFRRKKNDRLLMFILRHYGQDAAGRKTTINYFSTRATAGATTGPSPLAGEGLGRGGGGEAAEGALAAAEASTTTVKTVITGAPGPSEARPDDDESARLLESFAGVALDEEAKADIYRALEQAAQRRRALEADPAGDPEIWYVGAEEAGDYAGELEIGVELEDVVHRPDGEHRWESLGEGGNAAEIDRVVAEMKARRAAETPEDRAAREAAEDAMAQAQFEKANRPLPGCAGGPYPPLDSAGRGTARSAAEGQPLSPAPGEPDLDPPVLSLPRAQSRGEACPEPVLSDVEGPVEVVEGDDPQLDWRNWKTGEYVAPADNSSPAFAGEGDHVKHGGGASWHPDNEGVGNHAPSEPDEPAPAKAGGGAARRPYKKRQPKPAFTPPDEAAEARAREEVAARRREAAVAEGARRKRRKATP